MNAQPPSGIVRITPNWNLRDYAGAISVRWGWRRMQYRVAPGLYALGAPGPESPVWVTANYKLPFDLLRRALRGLHGWILVLDTQGVNVWCAAGKGTFCTAELARRIQETQLEKVVSHRQLILPQLAASGVNAFKAAKQTGFRVIFGPVYARDIPEFLANGNVATPAMRRVHFTWRERLAVAPLELVLHFKRMLLAGLVLACLGGFTAGGFSWMRVWPGGVSVVLLWLATYVLAGLLGPLLLPWLPTRAFAVKGAALGMVLGLLPAPALGSFSRAAAWVWLVAAGASFLLLNFTGSTTFTSPSGVRKEIRLALPVQGAVAVLGCGMWVMAGWWAP